MEFSSRMIADKLSKEVVKSLTRYARWGNAEPADVDVGVFGKNPWFKIVRKWNLTNKRHRSRRFKSEIHGLTLIKISYRS